ncbi:endopeptidase La [candidate division KSB1 bacterium]|nr:endopeptidase La [candidate division KSB1 bacterium]
MAIPDELPILPLRDVVIYPSMVSPLIVARPSSVQLLEDVMKSDRIVGLVAQKSPEMDDPEPRHIFRFGTAANILKMLRFPDGSIRILIQGLERFRIMRYKLDAPYYVARIKLLADIEDYEVELDALSRNITNQFQKIITLVPTLPDELQIAVMNMKNPSKLADLLASNLNLSLYEKQEILESLNIRERLQRLTILVNRELEVLEMGSKIQTKVQTEMGRNQREYYLREQLKAIQAELGEIDDRTSEINQLREKVKSVNMPEHAEREAFRELDRLAKMPPGAAEYTVARTYIDWLISLPWSISSDDNLDLKEAQKVLDDDHYNLKKVKERILEYLAVRKLKADMKGPILCFVGPPGVGKTSLGRSIARAMNREFVRISLGGVHDEAEIRGHRRTYIGSLPGRIIQGIKNAGTNNPVFMLDEVDKIGQDFRGDPSSALLEVLDPEQNNSFSDHYLDLSFDLSKVFFITTANYMDPIPPALKDRMETLELPGYTEEEKLKIAVRYLIPKQRKEHGLTGKNVSFQKSAIKTLITEYTREAGLRNLEREIASICRKVAKNVASGNTEKVSITSAKVHEFLGPQKYFPEIAERTNIPGVAVGLAWTPAGGDILFIESSAMKGNKGLTLTGQLGDVMKESAQAAMSYLRTKAKQFGIKEDFFEKLDVHLHVPAGAIPKDGPSAGLTIVTSLVSLLTAIPVKSDVAMTGEITLRGKVLPVGGIKEKILAAKSAGIKKVIMPKKNEKDLEEIAENVKNSVEFQFVENIDDFIYDVLKRKIPKSADSKK